MASNLRIGGLATGMDIESMISKLTEGYRMRVDKIKQNRTVAEWKKEDYRGINNSLRSLRDNVFNMKLESSYFAKKADSSDETVLTATPVANAAGGTYAITVDNLASGVTKGSQVALPAASNADGTMKTLSQQFSSLGLPETISFELAGNNGSAVFTFNSGSKTINDVVKAINGAKLGINASYDTTVNRFYLNTDSTGSEAKIQVVSDSANFLSYSNADGFAKTALQLNLKNTGGNNQPDPATNFNTLFGAGGFPATLELKGKAPYVFTVNDTDSINSLITNIEAQSATTGVHAMLGPMNRLHLYVDSSTSNFTVLQDTNGLLTGINSKLGTDLTISTAVTSADANNEPDPGTAFSALYAGFAATGKLKLQGLDKDGVVKGSYEFDVLSTDTVNTLITKINDQASTTGVHAMLDSSNRFYLYAEGTTTQFEALSDDHGLLTGANSKFGTDFTLGTPEVNQILGVDAQVDFGDTNNLKFATNTFTINNLTITAKKLGTANITVAGDVDKAYDKIKTFVDLYNTTLDKINGELNEPILKDSDRKPYKPPTDAQKEKLSAEQEKQWEDKARSGLFRNDLILDSAARKIRSTMASIVPKLNDTDYNTFVSLNKTDPTYASLYAANTKYDSLAAVGITTGDYSENGKLHIDETKLKGALAKDPQAVADLFMKTSTVDSRKGLAVRLYDNLSASINTLIDKAGVDTGYDQYDNSLMAQEISRYDTDINKWQDRITAMEDRYWKQFTAMETAISNMNQQSAWLAQQFGSGASGSATQ